MGTTILKYCSKCKLSKPLVEFNKDKWEKDGHSLRCAECNRAYRKALHAASPLRRQKNMERAKQRRKTPRGRYGRFRNALKARYGMTTDDYDRLWKQCGGACKICLKKFADGLQAPCVDHNHTSGKIRGLLCKACNFLIGYSYETIDVLINATEYLRVENGSD